MDLIMLVLFMSVAVMLGLTIYIVFKPILFRSKLGYIPVPSSRPAKSFILDNTKYCYGWGEVIGSNKLSPYKTSFRLNTGEGDLNVSYFRWELEALDKFDSIAGNNAQTFIVKESRIGLNQEKEKEELIKLRDELEKMTNEKAYLSGLASDYRYNTDRETDARMQAIMELKKADKPKEVIAK